MIKVKNGRAVTKLSRKSLRGNRTRNIVAICAIALTTLLFTALFTVSGTLLDSLQQQTFRQVGGDMYGTFKNISREQVETLRDDPLIVSSGARLLVGMPEEAPFNKMHTEISYMEPVCAKGYFCAPTHGALPRENTDEIACDTRMLELLGVEPKPGAKITLSYTLGLLSSGPKITDTFTLSGWWDFDEANQASMAVVPRSYAEKVLAGYTAAGPGDDTGAWDLNVYLKSSAHIQADLDQILKSHGCQSDDPQGENYVSTGVNWAYAGAQLSKNMDAGTAAGIAVLLALIVLTGYLIIYNIFQISVSGDIRFYGLLKTIGTTGKQLRQIIRRQALTLCVFGIPAGLALGWLVGRALSPAVLSTLNTSQGTKASTSPLIFAGAAAFALVTVLISCAKPGRVAGRVSPVEAVRWTEGSAARPSQNARRARKVTPKSMALANLSRGKKRTMLVVLSLSLAVVLLEVTYTFANGFDMDKYLDKFVVSDFILGSADYFSTASLGGPEGLPEEAIEAARAQDTVTAGGRIYGINGKVSEFVSEQRYREHLGRWNDNETLDTLVKNTDKNSEDELADSIRLYGMEDYPLDKLAVLDGSLDALRDPAQNAIAAVLDTDDYGKPIENTNWARVGDKVTIHYVAKFEYVDSLTGEPVDPAKAENGYYVKTLEFHDVTYTVAAVITMRNNMSYRYSGSDGFVLNAKAFQKETGVQDPMIYLFDTDAKDNAAMESFLTTYTKQIDPSLDYESKQSYMSEFTDFRDMFLLIGGALSAVIGLVGILNFLNAILTSILSRRREFAILQAVGMTGGQLRKMLVWEGESYAALAAVVSLLLSLAAGPLLQKAVSGFAWFFSYRFTITPVLIVVPIFAALGALLPLLVFRRLARQTIVERLRETES